jgi:5-(carboxyamino)imidazole ribonucleotide mutase
MKSMTSVAIIIGSQSDSELSEQAVKIIEGFSIPFDLQVISAHRNPEKLVEYVKNSDAEVFICIAGLAAALPGVVASHTLKPVIGVPKNVRLNGLDSLLSIVQMPTGVPVATVGIDGAKNAALLAAEILALRDPGLREKLKIYREQR